MAISSTRQGIQSFAGHGHEMQNDPFWRWTLMLVDKNPSWHPKGNLSSWQLPFSYWLAYLQSGLLPTEGVGAQQGSCRGDFALAFLGCAEPFCNPTHAVTMACRPGSNTGQGRSWPREHLPGNLRAIQKEQLRHDLPG